MDHRLHRGGSAGRGNGPDSGRPPHVGGELADAHEPRVRRAMAAGLAELIQLAAPYVSAELANTCWDWFAGPLPPRPHRHIFSTSHSPAALDRRSRRAGTERAGQPGGGHASWVTATGARRTSASATPASPPSNDWASLRLEPEVCTVAAAAVHFPATWYLEVPKVPTIEEVEAFLAEYEAARCHVHRTRASGGRRGDRLLDGLHGPVRAPTWAGERIPAPAPRPRRLRRALPGTGRSSPNG